MPQDADPLAAWDDFLARAGVPEDQRNTRSAIEDPDGHGPRVFFQQVPEDKVAKNRVHLDVRAAPGLQGEERMAALEAECDRLLALGATRLRRFEPAADERRLHRDGRPRGQRVLPGLTQLSGRCRSGAGRVGSKPGVRALRGEPFWCAVPTSLLYRLMPRRRPSQWRVWTACCRCIRLRSGKVGQVAVSPCAPPPGGRSPLPCSTRVQRTHPQPLPAVGGVPDDVVPP